MANLKTNLDEYLLANDSRRGFRWGIPDGWRSGWTSRTTSTPASTPSSESTDSSWSDKMKCDCIPTLTRTQRMIGFATCMMLGLLCFILSFILIPFLLVKARKFALLFTFGSCFIILSFSFLKGPWNHIKQMFSKERLLSTILYGSTLAATLYAAMGMHSTILTIIFAVLQVVVLVWITLGYVPGGASGVKTFGNIFKSSVSNTLPI